MIIPHPGQPTRMAQIAPILIILLCALSLGAGCTAPTGGGGGTQRVTQASPGVQSQTTGPAGEIYPGPTVTVPPIYDVQIQVNRNPNPVYPYITVTFAGGKGQVFLQKIVATMVPSVGMPVTKELDRPENGQISKGDSMTFTGTTGIDRIIVVVTILNTDYKMYDQNLDFNSHP